VGKCRLKRTEIRRQAFHYINNTLLNELNNILNSNGLYDFKIKLITENSSAMVVIVELKYKSILPTLIDYIQPVVKIEFSAMSLNEPYLKQEITSIIHSQYSEIDKELNCLFKSVLPERTFLEKIFLLHEEYHKINPRSERMSRHLYDIEKMINSPYAELAIQNHDLYKTIIQHRQKFNNIQGIDYQMLYPKSIQICPPERLYNEWKKDYEHLCESFIYDKSKITYDELIIKLLTFTDRIRKIKI